jgi:hypothetical protein
MNYEEIYKFWLFSELAKQWEMLDIDTDHDRLFLELTNLYEKFNSSHYVDNIDQDYEDNITHYFMNEER